MSGRDFVLGPRPRVSVCIPAFEQPALFMRALHSVLEQDFADLEVVVTDDSTGAAVAEVVDAMRDERVKYFRNHQRLGVPGNWNRGLELSTGEFIQVLHHDDWLATESALKTFVDALDAAPEADLAFCASSANRDGEVVYVHRPLERIACLRADPLVLLLGNWIGAPSAAMFRAATHARFDGRFRWLADVDLYLTVLSARPHFAYIAETMVATTTGAELQVTAAVQNTHVEVSEWFALYAKWAPRLPLHGERAMFLIQLLHRFPDVRWRDRKRLCLNARGKRIFVAAQLLKRRPLARLIV
jgi:glycosyltransferase involved in cell wall biosynthesis